MTLTAQGYKFIRLFGFNVEHIDIDESQYEKLHEVIFIQLNLNVEHIDIDESQYEKLHEVISIQLKLWNDILTGK